MKPVDLNKTWIGLLVGLFLPFLIFMGYHQIKYSYMDLYRFVDYLNFGQIFASVVTLCVLCNIGAFYLFLWTKKDYGARGVIFSTLIWGGFILYLKITTESL